MCEMYKESSFKGIYQTRFLSTCTHTIGDQTIEILENAYGSLIVQMVKAFVRKHQFQHL